MLPSLGFQEIVLLAIIALVVVGPKDLPLLLRKLGRWTAKLRGMAQEFRSGFDELARQAELDELRKEVDALRRHSSFSDMRREFEAPFDAPAPQAIPHDVIPHDMAHGAPLPAPSEPAAEAAPMAPQEEAPPSSELVADASTLRSAS